MLLKDQDAGKLLEVLATQDLYSPLQRRVIGRLHYGEEPGLFRQGQTVLCVRRAPSALLDRRALPGPGSLALTLVAVLLANLYLVRRLLNALEHLLDGISKDTWPDGRDRVP